MSKLFRPQTYPFASSSTGSYCGLLVRKYPCWDAQGPAREVFTRDIAGKIKTCLEQCLPESNSFVGFSLFMVGKLPEKTKPTIMIVSDDKIRRKAAFQIVKSRNILTLHPGFELGHCSVAAEFEDLKLLGSDAESSEYRELYDKSLYLDDEFEPGEEVRGLLSTEVCTVGGQDWEKPTRLCFHTSPNKHSHDAATATCGGLFSFGNEAFALTMAHALHPTRCAIIGPEPNDDSSSQSDDFEITGMDDWDDDDEDKTLSTVTSFGSKTSSEDSDSEESLLKPYHSNLSSDVYFKGRVDTSPPVAYDDESEDVDEIDACGPIGSVVSIDESLDIAVVKLTPTEPTKSFVLDSYLLVTLDDKDSTDTSIMIETAHNSKVRGKRSSTPFYTRLPGRSNFLGLYSAQLNTPMRHGDSGSWALDNSGCLIGFVIAGNTKTASCLLLPSRPALLSVRSLLQIRGSSAKPRSADLASRPEGALLNLRDNHSSDEIAHSLNKIDEDMMTVASSIPPPSIFSRHGTTPSTIAYSTSSTGYIHTPGNQSAQENPSHGNGGSAYKFASKNDFLESQAARLRRELERAWEIIQEKNKRLNELEQSLKTSVKDPLRFNFGNPFPTFQLGDGQSRGASLSSPSEQTSFSPPFTFTASRKTSPDEPTMPKYDYKPLLSSIRSLERKEELNSDIIDEMTTKWLREADANRALSQENRMLRSGVTQAVEAIGKFHGDRNTAENNTELFNIASHLEQILHMKIDSASRMGRLESKENPKSSEMRLKDIEPFSKENVRQPDKVTPLPMHAEHPWPSGRRVKPRKRREGLLTHGPGLYSTARSDGYGQVPDSILELPDEDEEGEAAEARDNNNVDIDDGNYFL
ncbi:hypothetical protein F4808DRAFT_394329 [Astrocystis sublimbata]|nr:hypothetical protein F4808DRAFT_394329 [Astrocystis sublimbata]